jgi:hypothetical protein
MKKSFIALIVAAMGLTATAQEVAPFQFGILMPDVAIETSTTRINGWATGIWIENPQSALATSFVNGSTGDSKGLSIGLLNYAENYSGVQWGLVNYVKGDFTGWQDGCFNYTRGTFTGFQSGIYNVSSQMKGFQLGLINTSENLHGLQVGVININVSNKCFTELPNELAPGMMFVNWKF